jgi:predicted ATPase
MLAGDAGIGKTWLLDRIGERATRRGAIVLSGGSLEAEGMPPYLRFVEALGAYVMATPCEELPLQLGMGAHLLPGLLPEIQLKLHDAEPTVELPPEQARLRLFDAISDFLKAIALRQPVVLLFDDLQWTDAATSDLLLHISRRNRTAPVLIFGAYRPGDADDNIALQHALAELGRRHLLAGVLDVEPLSDDDTRALAESQLGGPLAC